MRVLVVDQYASTKEGRAAWKAFFHLIVAGFDAQNIHANFSVRKGNNLDDFIYLPDSRFVQPVSLKNFDRIDMVFVGGEPSFRPWSSRIRQVLILLRMCFLTNKCLMATTFACHCLTYICATGGDPDIEIIKQGFAKRDLPNFKVPHDIRRHDLFLDVGTGDLFQYESFESRQGKVTSGAGSAGEWMPYCQSGLRMRSKFLLSLPRKYKPREPVGKMALQSLAANTIFETILTVRNKYIQHWAFRDTRGKSFLVSRYNEMDIDEKSSGSSMRAFKVLADSGDGLVPEIIECGNLFGTQFECAEAYPETVPLLHNFIKEKFKQMNRHGYTDISAKFLLMGSGPLDSIDGVKPADHRTINPSPLLARIRRQREEIVAERERLLAESSARKKKKNAETAANLRGSFSKGGRARGKTKPAKALQQSNSIPDEEAISSGIEAEQTKEQQRGWRRRPQSAKSRRKKTYHHIEDPRLQKPKAPADRKRIARPSSAHSYRALVLPASEKFKSLSTYRNKKAESKLGHNVSEMPGRPVVRFAPGSKAPKRAQGRADTSSGARKHGEHESASNVTGPTQLRWQNRKILAQSVVRTEVKEHKPFSMWNEKYKDLTAADKAFSVRPVAIGIAASGPYISQYKHERLDYMKSKLKWVGGNKGFRRFFGKASSAIGNPSGGIMGGGKYKEPSAYFREPDDRSRFIDPRRGWRKF